MRKLTGPKFTFVIPVLNGEQTISRTLRSVAVQTFSSFEIIVVDNASTDRTKALIQTFPNVKYVLCSERGRSQARNRGARLARGEYLAFVDADVILAPDWLEAVDRYHAKRPLDALATRIVPAPHGESALDRFREQLGHWRSRGTFLSVRSRTGAHPLINTAACVIRRQAFEEIGGFDESLRRHEDLNLSFRLFAKGYLLGGVTRARASVCFTADRNGPLAREAAYLRRSFEVQSDSLFTGRNPVNAPLLREIWRRNGCSPTFAFALLNESAWQLGGLTRRLHNRPPRWRQLEPGRNVVASAFSHQNRNYVLNRGMNFLFVDETAYLFYGLFNSKRLSPAAADALRKLCTGSAVTAKERESLMRLKAFHPASASSLTGLRQNLRYNPNWLGQYEAAY
jgi:glycosyltransferase involved in cell wall biosynthesis